MKNNKITKAFALVGAAVCGTAGLLAVEAVYLMGSAFSPTPTSAPIEDLILVTSGAAVVGAGIGAMIGYPIQTIANRRKFRNNSPNP